MLEFLNGTRKHGFLDYVGKLWRQHGDVFQVRLGTRNVMFAFHPDAVDQVTVSGRARYEKTNSFHAIGKYLSKEGQAGTTDVLWRDQSEQMAPFFTPKATGSLLDMVIGDSVRKQLTRQGDETEIADEMTRVTASIVLESMFSPGTMDSIEQIRGALETMISAVTRHSTGFTLPAWVPTRGNRKYADAQKLVRSALASMIEQRLAQPFEQWPDDLLSKMMSVRDTESGDSLAETLLRDEWISLLFAGHHKTAARTVSLAWDVLARHADVTSMLQAELDQVLAGRTPTFFDLRQLPYALQVVKEVLRLHPPVLFDSRDAVELDHIGPYEVLPDTTVLLSPHYTHRHPDYWQRPKLFDPERWDCESEAHNAAFLPFGVGSRVFLDTNFSFLESHLLLATLAQRFAPRLRQGYTARRNLACGLPAHRP